MKIQLEHARLLETSRFNSISIILASFGTAAFIAAFILFSFQLKEGLIGKGASFNTAMDSLSTVLLSFKLQAKNFKVPLFSLVFKSLSANCRDVLGFICFIGTKLSRKGPVIVPTAK